ncbi:MAG: hypothetical protein HMLIMOIP_001310 [Candidatus Nitrosomirales archaeon]|jgi:hypothetical protein
MFVCQQILNLKTTKTTSTHHSSYPAKMINEETEVEGHATSLRRALIFMIDAYSDSGVLRKMKLRLFLQIS